MVAIKTTNQIFMKQLFTRLVSPRISYRLFNTTMLLLRIVVSVEMILLHEFKKLGIGTAVAEQVPNPLHFPEAFNYWFCCVSKYLFPVVGFDGNVYQAGNLTNTGGYTYGLFHFALERCSYHKRHTIYL